VETDAGDITIEVNGGGRFQAIDGKGVIGEPADIAVRTDRVRLRETAYAGLGFTGIVQNVEYRGSSVKIVVNGAGVEDFTVIISDTEYFATPVKPGDAVPLSWNADDAIVLGRIQH